MKTTVATPTMLAGLLRQLVWIRIRCRGSVDCSADLRQFVELMAAQGHPRVVIDLESCPGMDSTFMGTLAGISLRLRQLPGGGLDIINAGERNLQSLRELGLDHILNVDCNGTLWTKERQLAGACSHEPVPAAGGDEQTRRATMTEAHETLCEVNCENVPRFRDVLELLRESRPE